MEDSPRTGRLGRFHGLEQLSEDPHQAVVVLTPEDLGDKVSTFDQELGGKLQRLQNQLVLGESVLNPSGTDVGSTIVEHQVGFPVMKMRAEDVATLRGGDIGDESRDMRQRFDRVKVDTDDQRALGHVLLGDLQPSTGRGTEIDCTF